MEMEVDTLPSRSHRTRRQFSRRHLRGPTLPQDLESSPSHSWHHMHAQPYHPPAPSMRPPDVGMSIVRRRPRATNGFSFVRDRETGGDPARHSDLLSWIEGNTLRRLDRGTYVTLDRSPPLVRSTISIAFSHDGKFFASTHGDHSVKVFRYPSGEQIACLDGHPRTPWTVRFHPKDSSILASGCLGSECRVWDVPREDCIRKHRFQASISCVSFDPNGSLLAVTSGKNLLLWNYMEKTRDGSRSTSTEIDGVRGPGLPRELLAGACPFHMVDFHPSGTMLMTGEKNSSPQHSGAPPPDEEQFTLKLVIHRFDRRIDGKFDDPILVVKRAVAYNDAGIHFSPCGTMLAACIPVHENSNSFKIAVMSLINRNDVAIGTVLYETLLDSGHVKALTNLKFSSTSHHLLAGFSFRPKNPVLRVHAEQYDDMTGRGPCGTDRSQVGVVDIYNVSENFEMIRTLYADMDTTEGQEGGAEDEINVAVFAPMAGVADGVVYGTQKGRIRMFQQATGRTAKIAPSCDNSVANRMDAECTGATTGQLSNQQPLPPARASSTTANVGEQRSHIRARYNSV